MVSLPFLLTFRDSQTEFVPKDCSKLRARPRLGAGADLACGRTRESVRSRMHMMIYSIVVPFYLPYASQLIDRLFADIVRLFVILLYSFYLTVPI